LFWVFPSVPPDFSSTLSNLLLILSRFLILEIIFYDLKYFYLAHCQFSMFFWIVSNCY
jgi:hypothetical protein